MPRPTNATPTKAPVDIVADNMVDCGHDVVDIARYPVSTFTKIGDAWYQITVHEVRAKKLISELNGDSGQVVKP